MAQKPAVRLFLDTNVWSYVADAGAIDSLALATRKAGITLVVSPAIVDEAQGLPNAAARKRLLDVVTDSRWTGVMPEVFSECAEIRAEIQRLRPQWVISAPNLKEIHRLRSDLVKRKGGF